MAETITNLDWQPNNEGQDLPQPLPITRKDQINHVTSVSPSTSSSPPVPLTIRCDLAGQAVRDSSKPSVRHGEGAARLRRYQVRERD
eukprot:749919-Hanusia_phi.AAC.1